MDSKVVSAGIRSEIRPFLREQGFTRFTGRNSWRYVGPRVDVVNFQSFNSYNAGVLGCTSYSFAVNLGCYLTDIPFSYDKHAIETKDGGLRPKEYECQFRGRLRPRIVQPKFGADDIWYIDPEGQLIEPALNDVRGAIARDAIPWFERLSQRGDVLDLLLHRETTEALWGFGRLQSPFRDYLTGYVALSLGRGQLAKDRLQQALNSGSFDSVSERLKRDIQGVT